MKQKIRWSSVLVLLLIGTMVFAAGQKENGAAKPVVLKISIAETSNDVKADVLDDFIAEVEAATEGRIKFEMYYSNELGSLADVTEQMVMGGNILAGTSGDFYATYGSPDIMATALFFALPSADSVQKFNDSALFAKMADDIEKASGLKMLAMNWAAAPRSVISTKPLNSVNDLRNLKIRVPGAAAASFFQALGSATESMPFSDIYTAMSQGVLQAAEAPLSTLYGYSLHEVAKYVYLSEHSLAPSCWAMSAKIFNSLSAGDQKILQDAINKYGRIFTAKGLETEGEYRQKMEEAGVTFIAPTATDIARLKEAGKASFDTFPEMSKGLYDQISSIID
jgi:TRAP-type C4-dicarboxylate transport system substrate-binding protein